MRVLVMGASGLVGRATLERLLEDGHQVLAASRDPDHHQWPVEVQPIRYKPGRPAPGKPEAIVNLAGASVGGKRWTKAYKQTLVASRVQATKDAVAAQPQVLVQASAIGYYGINPDGPCPESRSSGDDFLAQLCDQWEAAAAEHDGRTVIFRIGHVLDGGDEGILGRLVPLYRARLGGRIGSGKQGMPWVHVGDVARAIAWAINSNQAEGPYNLAAPQAVSQSEFNAALANALGVAAPWWIPGPAMRVAVGGLGPYLVGGQHTPPGKLLEQGFQFDHPTLDGALANLFPKASA